MTHMDDFRNLWNAGFRSLVPITPPDAALSPRSALARRKGSPGKIPGIRNRDGLWSGFDWIKHTTTESDLAQWGASGAGVGIRTGDGLIAIDVDTKNPDLCVKIGEVIQQKLGSGAVRVGNAPKFLVLFRTRDDIPYERIEFSDGGVTKAPRVEILTKGRQFVAAGTHPDTRKPYRWPKGLPDLNGLPFVTQARVTDFFDTLASLLPEASLPVVEARAGKTPSQHSLKGDYEHVKRAVGALPNTEDLFPTYDDYVRVGAAIKGALQDAPEVDALELFLQWAGRWPDFDLETATSDFKRIKPPFRCGAGWLYDHADRYSNGAFNRADVFFHEITGELETDPDIFTLADEANRAREKQEAAVTWIDPRQWEGKAPPPRQWLVDGLIPAGEVTLLTGAGGVGKTLLAQQMATCVAAGLPFLGLPTRKDRVLLFLCEDDEHELHRRQRDVNNALVLSMTDIANDVRIASRKHMDNLIVTFDRGTGRMTKTALWHSIFRMLNEFQPGLIVGDTIADLFGGSEIDRQQVRQFVQTALGGFAAATGCAVLALGHPSRAGESSGEGTSGSTAWHASVRSRLYLSHATKDGRGPFRRLQAKKANYGPAGSEWTLRWEKGFFHVHTAAMAGAGVTAGEGGGGPPDKASTLADAVMHAAMELANRGVVTSLAKNSPNYAARIMHGAFTDLLGMFEVKDVGVVIDTLVADGKLSIAKVGRRPDRHPKYGLKPVVRLGEEPTEGQDVFG